MKSMNLFGNTKSKKKTYTEDFKKKAVNIASKVGVTKAAEELGVSTSSIYSWQKSLSNSTLTKKLPPAPIQDENGNLTFCLERKTYSQNLTIRLERNTYSLNVNSEKERERVKEEVNANSLAKYDWFKEETGENHWVFYNTEMYVVDYDRFCCRYYLHYKEDCDLNSVIPINATSCHQMFSSCESLTQLDLSNLDTSQVTTMFRMFGGCRYLTQLNISNFDTSNVTRMDSMFTYCESLTNLDLSSFDTSNVTSMDSMFDWCLSLTQLNLSNFDTSQVTKMWCMFKYCRSLIKLDLSNFDTNECTNTDEMFAYCKKLITIKISNQWNTDSVKFSFHMFEECFSLPNYDSAMVDIEMAKPIEEGGYLTLQR